MKFTDLYPSRFMKAADLGKTDLIVTITAIDMEELGQERDEKPVLSFSETSKKLVLNKGNGLTVAALFGDECAGWIGKRISLFATRVPFGGKLVDSIRIRDREPGATTTSNTVEF